MTPLLALTNTAPVLDSFDSNSGKITFDHFHALFYDKLGILNVFVLSPATR
jgi:hypothetical protein